jgi:hypothetical protein
MYRNYLEQNVNYFDANFKHSGLSYRVTVNTVKPVLKGTSI